MITVPSTLNVVPENIDITLLMFNITIKSLLFLFYMNKKPELQTASGTCSQLPG